MKVMFPSRLFVLIATLTPFTQSLLAQSTSQLFGPINARSSPTSAGFGQPFDNGAPYTFGGSAISLTCPAGSTVGLQGLGSDSNPNSYLMVDNNIILSIAQGVDTHGNPNVLSTSNICPVNNTTLTGRGLYNNHCFDVLWESAYSSHFGVSGDTLAPTFGIPPFDFTAVLQATNYDPTKPVILTFDLEDEGGVLDASTIVLKTTCNVNGVTGPATVGGNPISGSTDQGTAQDFTFGTAPDKLVGFGYDVTGALNTLTGNADGSLPQVSDLPLDQTKFQPIYAPATSFATSMCIIHNGEVLADGVTPACKLYVLACQSPDGSSIKGANCPVSSQVNEVVQDQFDGPPINLQNIVTPFGIFRQGMGFLMASEPWTGGSCTFDPSSGLAGQSCPENLLTSFTGPGAFSGTGLTTNPNSTFISVYGVPEDFTLAVLQGELLNHWVNTRTPKVSFLTLAPNFTKGAYVLKAGQLTALPGAASYRPAPIKSITFGASAPDSVPNPINEPIAGDTSISPGACPAPPYTSTTVPNFTSGAQQLSFNSDGKYVLHYYAQDCAGTQELSFTQDGSGSWMTNFFTRQVNVDTQLPSVVGLAVPAPGSFKKGTTVYATYNCTDVAGGSGVVLCGTNIYGTETTFNTGALKTKLNTSSTGPKSLVINVMDGAGNLSSATVNYTVTN